MSEPRHGEHRHMVGGLLREHIPARALCYGESVFVLPQVQGRPRAAKAGEIPPGGMVMKVNEYVYSMAQRGAVLCFSRDGEPAEQNVAAEGEV